MSDNPLIEQWQGTPYRPGGRDSRGVDCLGIVYAMFDSIGVRLPGSRIPKTNMAYLLSLLRKTFEAVRGDYKPFDFLIFRLNGGSVLHVGIYAGNDTFLHILGSGGVKAEPLSQWRAHFVKAYRYRRTLCREQ